jgi:hypothetical protein
VVPLGQLQAAAVTLGNHVTSVASSGGLTSIFLLSDPTLERFLLTKLQLLEGSQVRAIF